MATATHDKVVTPHLHIHGAANGKITPVSDIQGGAIADLPHAAGANPTAEEHDALVDAVNLVLRAIRSGTGVGIIASS